MAFGRGKTFGRGDSFTSAKRVEVSARFLAQMRTQGGPPPRLPFATSDAHFLRRIGDRYKRRLFSTSSPAPRATSHQHVMTRASALATRSASVTISPECTVHVTHSDTNFLPLGLISILVSATGLPHTSISSPATCATPSSGSSGKERANDCTGRRSDVI